MLDRSITFYGNTHVHGGLLIIRLRVSAITGVPRKYQTAALDLNPDEVYMINPGAIGQPRDGDPRAAYVIYNSEDRSVVYNRQKYDIPAVQSKIRRAGLPDMLAERLASGQ